MVSGKNSFNTKGLGIIQLGLVHRMITQGLVISVQALPIGQVNRLQTRAGDPVQRPFINTSLVASLMGRQILVKISENEHLADVYAVNEHFIKMIGWEYLNQK